MRLHAIILATIIGTGLTASAYNLDRSAWSWTSSSICAPDGTDITGLDGIHDNNPATCWHSNWHAASGSAERSNPHWVQIDRGADRSQFDGLAYLPRQSSANQACTSYYIYLSDNDMSSTPATSEADIIAALGYPTLSGSWDGDTSEKFATLKAPSTARYILFVNLSSLASSSAACAEMNLYYGEPGESSNPETDAFNAIKITPVGSSSTPHRIAIKDGSLTMSINFGYVRFSNSDITIEYAPTEVSRYNFEHYDFVGQSYTGDKKDVLSSTFNLSVTPAAGKVETLNEVTIATPADAGARINPAPIAPVTIESAGQSYLSVAQDALPTFAADGLYRFSGIGVTTPGKYKLHVPAELFIAADGSRSAETEIEWTIPEQNSIDQIAADCPTLALAVNDGTLTISGIPDASTAMLYDAAGRLRLSATANASGQASLNVASLPKGVYMLNINDITLKIIL